MPRIYIVNEIELNGRGLPSDKYVVAINLINAGGWCVVYRDEPDEGAVDTGIDCEGKECSEICLLIDALGSVDAAKEMLGS